MACPLRIEYSGAVHHITSRGNEKKAVFKDDHDRQEKRRWEITVEHWDDVLREVPLD